MSGPDRNYSMPQSVEHAGQLGYPPYSAQREVSPVEGHPPQFPSSEQSISPPPPPVHRNPVGMHPDSTFNQMHNQRQYVPTAAAVPQNYSDYTPPGVTPGADNLGESSAGGGINGIALGVANSNERESGVQALRDINNWGRSGDGQFAGPRGVPPERSLQTTPFSDHYSYNQPTVPRPIHSQPSYGSNAPLATGAMTPGLISHNSSEQSIPLGSRSLPPSNVIPYQDNPYNRYSSSNLNLAPAMGEINPSDLADDDDWGMGPQTSPQQKRRSFIPFGASRDGSREGLPSAAAGATAVGAGATAYQGARDASGTYASVPQGNASDPSGLNNEKSTWLKSQNHGRKRLTWIVASIIAILVVGAIVGGVLGAVLGKHGGDKGASSASAASNAQSVAQDNKDDLTKDSAEIQKLMNNQNLHKVFPGMDYTPLNTQYPDCLSNPPSQNNVTRDMAVLSQLTTAVRLYGTDCNQTEMVLHAIDKLGLTDMKLWLGVWLGTNGTTNKRQIAQMWNILDENKSNIDVFKGIIVGNEVLYRKDLTTTQLLGNITEIKTNLTQNSINLPVATSDLGDNWTADMATQVDIVMSNVHPFFAGVEVDQAAGWTWDFWQSHDVELTANNASIKQIIAEVGWPSGGGNDCGGATCTSTTQGSVASIDNMNSFMSDWVCQSLANQTEYFWFEAFDEPWKVVYNTADQQWEDKWGLMDANRNLKSGLTIPDCGGKTVS